MLLVCHVNGRLNLLKDGFGEFLLVDDFDGDPSAGNAVNTHLHQT